jgi:hypothetical protein
VGTAIVLAGLVPFLRVGHGIIFALVRVRRARHPSM